MPAKSGETWSTRTAKLQDFSEILKSLMKKLTGTERVEFTSHSLKAMQLSWLAKRGVPKETRKALGYHIEWGDRSMKAYSRDGLRHPLRVLRALLMEISLGQFTPDGKSKRAPQPVDLEKEVLEIDEWDAADQCLGGDAAEDDDGFSSGDEVEVGSSDESDCNSDLTDEGELDRCEWKLNRAGCGDELYISTLSLELHRGRLLCDERLGCGRLVTGSYRLATEQDEIVTRSVKCRDGCWTNQLQPEHRDSDSD